MTWKLLHNDQTVGEWTDEFVLQVADKVASEPENITAEFLPDPIRQKIEGPTFQE